MIIFIFKSREFSLFTKVTTYNSIFEEVAVIVNIWSQSKKKYCKGLRSRIDMAQTVVM